jgi:hypothetical protein
MSWRNQCINANIEYSWSVARLDPTEIATSILQLREGIDRVRDRTTRSALRDVEVRLRRALGPTITKTRAAKVLGISVTALDRWVDRSVIPVVARPGSTRVELEAGPFLELAREARRVRAESPGAHTPIAAAVRRLGWKPRLDGRRVLRLDVAELPRPNILEQELVERFRSTTPEERVCDAAELSLLFAPAHERPTVST